MTSTVICGRPFAVIASQRTGSTVLVRSLDTSPLIFCAGEIFHAGPHVHHREYNFYKAVCGSRFLGQLADFAFEYRRTRRHLSTFFASAGRDVQAVGFKVMISQIRQRRTILPVLIELGADLLLLYRRDSFATALSYYRAKVSGHYHSDRVSVVGSTPVVTADVGDFGKLLARCESEKTWIKALHAAHGGALLAYEDMLCNWDQFIDSVGQALGISRLRIPAVLERVGVASPSVTIENEGELRLLFGERPYD